MSHREEKIKKLISKLVKHAIMMGYNVQETDRFELNKEEIFVTLKEKRLTETQIIEKFAKIQ